MVTSTSAVMSSSSSVMPIIILTNSFLTFFKLNGQVNFFKFFKFFFGSLDILIHAFTCGSISFTFGFDFLNRKTTEFIFFFIFKVFFNEDVKLTISFSLLKITDNVLYIFKNSCKVWRSGFQLRNKVFGMCSNIRNIFHAASGVFKF